MIGIVCVPVVDFNLKLTMSLKHFVSNEPFLYDQSGMLLKVVSTTQNLSHGSVSSARHPSHVPWHKGTCSTLTVSSNYHDHVDQNATRSSSLIHQWDVNVIYKQICLLSEILGPSRLTPIPIPPRSPYHWRKDSPSYPINRVTNWNPYKIQPTRCPPLSSIGCS